MANTTSDAGDLTATIAVEHEGRTAEVVFERDAIGGPGRVDGIGVAAGDGPGSGGEPAEPTGPSHATLLTAASPTFWFTMSHPDGATELVDNTGNGHTATLPNGPLTRSPDLAGDTAGAARHFDGTTTYARIPHAPGLNADTFTISALVSVGDATGYRTILSHDGASRSWSLYVRNGRLHLVSYPTTDVTAATDLTPGQIHHVAVTYDGATSRLRMYLDGTLDYDQTVTLGTAQPNAFTIGSSYAGTAIPTHFRFYGALDEIAYWAGSTLSPEQIADLAATRTTTNPAANTTPIDPDASYPATVTAANPTGWWRLDDPTGAGTATDSSANGLHAAAAGAVTFARPGLVGGTDAGTAAEFTGGDLEVPAGRGLVGPFFSASALITPTEVTGYRAIISRDHVAGRRGWTLYVQNGRLQLLTYPGATITGTTPIVSVTRYHVAVTHDGATARVYVNGVLDGQGTGTTPGIQYDNPVVIGASYAGVASKTLKFTGVLDEVALWHGSYLTDAHIAAQAAAAGLN